MEQHHDARSSHTIGYADLLKAILRPHGPLVNVLSSFASYLDQLTEAELLATLFYCTDILAGVQFK